MILEFYTRPQSGQFYMINILENQWLSVTYRILKSADSLDNPQLYKSIKI